MVLGGLELTLRSWTVGTAAPELISLPPFDVLICKENIINSLCSWSREGRNFECMVTVP